MEQVQAPEVSSRQPDAPPLNQNGSNVMPSVSNTPNAQTINCPTCGAQSGVQDQPSYVYVIGHIQPRYPLPSVEKEFKQATKRAGRATVDLADRAALQKVLQEPENRYLVRQLCWVLQVQSIDTYILWPRDPVDYQLLVDALRSSPAPTDLDVVIGVRGPIAAPSTCNGLVVPMLVFDQVYSFDRDTLLNAIPKPKGAEEKKFTAAAAEMFDRIMQQSDNAGATEGDRALNYLAVRYDQIYARAARAFADNQSFTSIDVLPSRLSGTRRIVDVVFSFTDRTTDVVDKSFVRVDVTEEFPFLVTPISPYYERPV